MKNVWSWMTLAVLALVGTVQAASVSAVTPPPSQRFDKFEKSPDVSYRRHVLPLLGRAGCNGRACHGSFQGQGGFQLSLFGYDFAKDHQALAGGDKPRANLKDPEQSLILLKPTTEVEHEGGSRFDLDSWEYNIIRKWVAQGVPNDAEETGYFDRLEIHPQELVFEKEGQQVQLQVLAYWSDGTVEDVTEISRFQTNDESVADVSKSGKVTSRGKGDTHIVAFYDNGVAPVPAMLAVSDRIGLKFPKVPTPTKIDELVVQKLRKVGVVPSDVCSDAEFLRRASLDLTGTLPTPQEIEAFIADTTTDKRARKIDELMQRPGYAAWWTTKLCDITGNNAQQMGDNSFRSEFSRQWYDWIYKRVAENEPYDKIVGGIVLATSREADQNYVEFCEDMSSYVRRNDAAEFAERSTMPHYWSRRNMRKSQEKALSFSYAFLGVRLQCAECHKHPFDQWTQQDFQQFQAFFEPIAYGTNPSARDDAQKIQEALNIKGNARNNQIRNQMANMARQGKVIPWQELYVAAPRNANANRKRNRRAPAGRVITPKLLGGEQVMLNEYPDPREALMDWLRGEDNPYFAAAFVNRVWANHFGVGIVDPVDDLNLANPPANKALLDYLSAGFVESGYDMKWLHRTIMTSDTYQRSWQTNETNVNDRRNFSHALIRRLPAEVAYDAIVQAVASSDRLMSVREDVERRAIGPIAGLGRYGGRNNSGPQYALSVFGKPQRETTCDCERSDDPTLLQTLFLRNDTDMLRLIDEGGWISELGGGSADRNTRTNNSRDAARRKQQVSELQRLVREGKIEREEAQRRMRRIRSGESPAPEPAPLVKHDVDKLIRETYLRTVSRPPTPQELADAGDYVKQSENVADGVRDLLWTMLNTKEFIVNH